LEKSLKVTLGLASLSEGHRWPNGKAFGHNIFEMNSRLLEHLDAWQSREPQSQWLGGLLQALQTDPIWPALLVVLDTYARSGRFAYLDRLAEVSQPPLEPRPLWDVVEAAALTSRPELRSIIYHDPPVPNDAFEAGLSEMNRTVARSLARWWFTVARVGAFGAYGDQGRRFAPELEPGMVLPALPEDLRKPG
jgi:hypothetical protein